jgi:hypothetical protein
MLKHTMRTVTGSEDRDGAFKILKLWNNSGRDDLDHHEGMHYVDWINSNSKTLQDRFNWSEDELDRYALLVLGYYTLEGRSVTEIRSGITTEQLIQNTDVTK